MASWARLRANRITRRPTSWAQSSRLKFCRALPIAPSKSWPRARQRRGKRRARTLSPGLKKPLSRAQSSNRLTIQETEAKNWLSPIAHIDQWAPRRNQFKIQSQKKPAKPSISPWDPWGQSIPSNPNSSKSRENHHLSKTPENKENSSRRATSNKSCRNLTSMKSCPIH